MEKTLVKIDNPAALSILREFKGIHDKAHTLLTEAEKDFTQRRKDIIDGINVELNESLERLRLNLGYATFGETKPEVILDYIDHDVAFLRM